MYLKWVIGDGVSEEDRRASAAGIRIAHDYARLLCMPEMATAITFYLFHDLEALAAAFECDSGLGLERGGAGRGFATGQSLAVASGRWIVLNTSVP